MESIISQGIAAAKAGNNQLAAKLLAEAVQSDPTSAEAWFWLGKVIEDPDKQAYCFARANNFNPTLSPFITTHPDQPSVYVPPFDESRPINPVETVANTPHVDSPAVNPVLSEPPTQPRKPQANKKSGSSVILLLISAIFLGLTCLICFLLLQTNGSLSNFSFFPKPTATRLSQIGTPDLAHALSAKGTATFTPTFIHPDKTATATRSADQVRETLNSKIKEGLAAMDAEMFSRSLEIWDGIISDLPEFSEAYYQRGKTYRLMNVEVNKTDVFLNNLGLAIQDLDHAIDLDPNNGNYYYERSRVYADIAVIKEERVESSRMYLIALENIQMANALGNTQENSTADYVIFLQLTGQCKDALSATQNLILERDQAGLAKNTAYNEMLASNYNCLEQYDQAIINQQIVVDRNPVCSAYNYPLAVYLYNAGKRQESLDLLNKCIGKLSYFAGERYYLRALIEFDRGKTDLATNDLDIGVNNTWIRGGLNAYVRGKLARRTGDSQKALEYLLYAEATWPIEMDWMRPTVQAEIRALGGNPSVPEMTPEFETTPLPTLPPDFPTATPQP
jgi:tetratricopeptide (TPR) repeat protein